MHEIANHPGHADGFLRGARERFPKEADAYHHFFQVSCPCGETRFHTFLSNKRSLRADCIRCGRSICVYDLAHYRAAKKSRGAEEYQRVLHSSGEKAARVFVMYEYGQFDVDQEFDRNDISWCQAWLEDGSGNLMKILDDETA